MTFLPINGGKNDEAKSHKPKKTNFSHQNTASNIELCINHYQTLHGDALEVCEHNWGFILIVLFVVFKATKIGIVLILWPSSS